ncbi:hypothetical protein CDO26_24755 (plasmid) [Sinorhizobium meliloti]|nr:hypothetical protein CDO26_24755 [Sinorhizobium meliloti]MQW24796.1 hypothetical protein [Sinorhizobium meliloti]
MLQSHDHTDAVLPAGVNLLDEVFTEILTEKGLCRDCEAAELIARTLFALFQSGVREKEVLRNLAMDYAEPEVREKSC